MITPKQSLESIPNSPPASSMSQIEAVLIAGDLGRLTPAQREVYYMKVCETLALNPLTKPFDYITLNGKLVLYANKGCAEQLRSLRKISITVTSRDMTGDLCVVTANARNEDGREDSSTGAVSIAGLKGEQLANAVMKAETKAKRRVTLSICGLNMFDESEVEDITDDLPKVKPGQPDEGDGHAPEVGEYRIGVGQWKNLSIDEVMRKHGPEKVAAYIEYLEDPKQVAARKPEHVKPYAEFIERASEAIAMFEYAAARAVHS